ncbi:MAG TPA: ribokinase [Bryobacteraceae bacterium]|nr:ribokinase [Bryobacteraceae bacterium]
MDFVVSVERLPSPGETVLGREFQMLPGGKGANQACAAGRLGTSAVITRMIGRVGYDVFGDHLKASLSAAGVDVSFVHATRSQPTGVALIWVDRTGQNSIVVASGANHALLASEVEAMRPVFRGARFALFQLESPLAAVAAALSLARSEDARTMLDPAPAQPLSPEVLALVDILTPNETEASILLGVPPGRVSKEEAPALARRLRERGPRAVVLKLGDQGCFYLDGEQERFSPGFAVEARDATAAGDVFNAALAVAMAEDQSVVEALRFANAAAAISVTRLGAQASVPARPEVDSFLASRR